MDGLLNKVFKNREKKTKTQNQINTHTFPGVHLFYFRMQVILVFLIACSHEKLLPSFENTAYFCVQASGNNAVGMFVAPSAKCSSSAD